MSNLINQQCYTSSNHSPGKKRLLQSLKAIPYPSPPKRTLKSSLSLLTMSVTIAGKYAANWRKLTAISDTSNALPTAL